MIWNKETKEIYMFRFAVVSFAVGVILIFTGMFMPPVGEINGNVLIGCGEFLSFTAALLGINVHYDNELQKFKSRVINTIENEERLYNHHNIHIDNDVDVVQDNEVDNTDNQYNS